MKYIVAIMLALSLMACGKRVDYVEAKPQFYEYKAENGMTCVVIMVNYSKDVYCK